MTPQGAAGGFDVQALYSRSEHAAEGSFGEQLAAAVRRGDVEVNAGLLDEMRGGLLVADEIHNAYNILEKNNYGIAIQYALDALGDEAPRAVFMSYTPMTGSAGEIIDLLNLAVPRSALPGGMPLRRADFFARAALPEPRPRPAGRPEGDEEEGEGPTLVVSQLLEGALERIGHLAAGRVSFLLDTDVGSYPRRIFVGEEVPGVPYLRLTLCPMSPFHARTLAREQAESGAKSSTAGLAANAYTLYDMAFPNPEFPPDAALTDTPGAFGLYRSGETPARLVQAGEGWRSAAGVIVERGAEAGVSSGTYVISGGFLEESRLAHYGAKPARVVADALAAIRAGPGKIMIYHHRVRMSGVLLYQEALRMNGVADELSAPTDATICAVCGVPRKGHAGPGGPPHEYTPARFVVAHSDIDRAVMLRSLARYNAPSNAQGYQYRIVIGSKVVREGLTFRAVRHQLVASLPTDIPTLIQVFGRVVRKDSHLELPEDARDVRIRVYVTTNADGRPSPELQRYIDKGREFLVIQEVERALRVYAVDGFANYPRIRAALLTRESADEGQAPRGPSRERRAAGGAAAEPRLAPVQPARRPRRRPAGGLPPRGDLRGVRPRRAGGSRDSRRLPRPLPRPARVDLRRPLGRRSVGRGPGRELRRGPLRRGELRARAREPRPARRRPASLRRAGRRVLRRGPRGPRRGALGRPPGPRARARPRRRELPAGAAPRGREGAAWPALPQKVAVRVADYLRGARSGQNFAVRLREFEHGYLLPGARSALELSLVEYGASFHYALLRRLIAGPGPATRDDARVGNLYRRFRIAVTLADASSPAVARVFRGSAARDPDALIGYVTPDAVALYDDAPPAPGWYSASHADFGIGRRHRENDIVVGFVVSVGEAAQPPGAQGDASSSFAAASAEARFKIRPPLHQLRAAAAALAKMPGRKTDARSLARGAVCETRPRAELQAYARRLRDAVLRVGATRLLPEPPARVGGEEPEEEPEEEPPCGCSEWDGGSPGVGPRRGTGNPGTSGGFAPRPPAAIGYAAQHDRAAQKKLPSAPEMCDALRLHLLALEENARAPENGMAEGLRWLYLFNDRPPTISALIGK